MRVENDLGRDPIRPLVLRIAIPSMLAQFVSVFSFWRAGTERGVAALCPAE